MEQKITKLIGRYRDIYSDMEREFYNKTKQEVPENERLTMREFIQRLDEMTRIAYFIHDLSLLFEEISKQEKAKE